MRDLLFVNELAGGLIDVDHAAFRMRAELAFQAAGRSVEFVTTTGADLTNAIGAAVRSGQSDRIVVAGGDGTIRTAAQHLAGTGVALGIVPCGTLNRLARDLGLPLDLDAALSALANAEVQKIDVGEVNRQIFLCQSMLGLPVHLAKGRQAIRGKALGARAAALVRLSWESLLWSRKLNITLNAEGEQRRLRTLSLAIVTGEFSEAPSLLLQRIHLDRGELTLYASQHETGIAFAASFLRGLTGRFKDDRQIEIHRGRSLVLEGHGGSVTLSNDGELQTLAFPLEFRIRPGALCVLVPERAADTKARYDYDHA